jgi:hypothetical protein
MSEKFGKLPIGPGSSQRDIADYINHAFETSDIVGICEAIGAATHLHNISDIAKKSGIERSSSLLLRRVLGSKTAAEMPSAPTFTDAIAGSLFTNANFRKVMDTLRNAADLRKVRPGSCVWLVPQVSAWGATRALPVMLDQITDRLASDDRQSPDEGPARSIALVAGRPPNHLGEAFDLVVSGHDVAGIPPGLEVMLVPGLMVAI